MQKKHILMVEDDLDIRENLTEFLISEGYAVQTAADGQQALDFLREASDLPQVILLDLRMPNMDGFRFRAEQEKDARLALIPVILMTADAQIEAEKIRIGAKAYVKKPIDIEALAEMLRAFLK